MRILAIDPGTEQSAWVVYHPESRSIVAHEISNNLAVLEGMRDERATLYGYDACVIEMVASYGQPVGREVFETVLFIGRLVEACPMDVALMYRKDVKLHLCCTVKGVNDAVIRQRLIDLFGPGRERAIGKKATPGPLYGIYADEWAALAVAVTYAETRTGGPRC